MDSVADLMTTAAVARRLGVSRARVHQLMQAGVLPVHVRLTRRLFLFHPAVVSALAAQRQRGAEGQQRGTLAPGQRTPQPSTLGARPGGAR